MATTRATELGQLAKLVTVDSNGNSVIAGTFDATLPASGVVAGVHGSASSVPIMSVTAQGLIDSVGSAPINTATSLSFDSATGQLTLGFSDTSTISQTLTLDPFTTDDLTEGSNLYYSDARFDSAFGVKTTADLTEGSNLYYTDVRFDSAFGDKSTTNLTEGDNLYYTQGRFDSALGDKTTDNLTEGSNLYYTTARADSDAKAAISVTDAGGDGSLTYSAGAITYTGPSASEVRAHFSGGTGVDISSGVVSIGQNVDSSSSVIFQSLETTGNVTIGGNLQVNGATTTVSSQNLSIEDNMLYLNQLESDGSPTIEVDVGFAANVNDTGTYAHTGFFRDATDATWKLFDGYTPEPDSDLDIDINHASFEYADLQVADLTAGNITVSGTVDGRDVAADGTKLDGIESGATADQTKADIEALNINADQVDGLEASQFLRSDTSDAMTGTLTVNSDTIKLYNSTNTNNTFLIAENSGAGNAGLQIKNQDGTWTFIANDRLRIIDGDASAERLSILSNGNVGIGSTSPNYKLQVNGNLDILNLQGSSGNAFIRFTDGDATADWSVGSDDGSGGGAGSFIVYDRNNTAYRLAIKSNGYVGIDTANPGEKLQVDAGNIHVGGVTSSTALTSGSQYKLKMGQQYWAGTKGTDASIKLELYSLSASDTYGLGISSSELEIQSQQDIGFYAGGSSTRTKRMHIEGSNGNVGIGTTSPDALLDIEGNFENTYALKFTNTFNAGRVSGFRSHGGNGEAFSLYHDNDRRQIWNSDGSMTFENGSGNDQLHITSGGDVGIGTTSPEAYLDINTSGIGGTQAPDWTNLSSPYATQPNNTIRNVVITNRHSASKHTIYGYGGPTIDFRNNNTSDEWEGAKIMSTVDPFGTSGHKGGLVFFANSDGSGSDPSGRLTKNTPSVVHMALGDKRVYIPYTMNIGDYSTTHNYSLNSRPQIKLEGSYPHLFLIDDVNNNTTHGPVISMGGFVGSAQRRWNIGVAANNPSNLSIGYYDNNANPHYGTGTGWASDAYTRFSVYTDRTEAKGSMRAPIFYDYNDTTYYVDPASSSTAFNGNGNGVFKSSSGDSRVLYLRQHVTNGGNIVQFIDQNGSNTWEVTGRNNNFYIYNNQNSLAGAFKIHPGNNNTWINPGSSYASDPGYRLRVSGNIYSDSDIRSPIFYDSNNTAYYFDGHATGDSIRVAGDIVAYYSDERLKDKEGNISGAIDKVSKLNGFYYRANKKAQELGYDTKLQVGVSAQEVEAVLPEVVKDAPIGHGYKTVKYDRMVPLLIEAIKEQQEIINKQSQDIDELKQLVKQLMENK